MLQILWLDSSNQLMQKSLEVWKNQLSKPMRERADRYLSASARLNYLAGRFLLHKGLEKLGLSDKFHSIEFLDTGKPYVAGVEFNISHTEGLVICAFSDVGIGIDVERIVAVNFDNFSSFFSEREWKMVRDSDKPLNYFYRLWVRKEGLIKLLGVSLQHLEGLEVSLERDWVVFGGKQFFFKEFDFGADYVACACSATPFSAHEIEIIKTEIYE